MTLTIALVGMLLVAQAHELPVLTAEKTWAGADVLWPLAESGDPMSVLRGPRHRPSGGSSATCGAADDGQRSGVGPLAADDGRRAVPERVRSRPRSGAHGGRVDMARVASRSSTPRAQKNVVPGPIGNIRWGSPEHVHRAEEALLRILTLGPVRQDQGRVLYRRRRAEPRVACALERPGHAVQS